MANSSAFFNDLSSGKLGIGAAAAPAEPFHVSTTAVGASTDISAFQNLDGGTSSAVRMLFLTTGSLSGWTNGLSALTSTRTSTGATIFTITQSPGTGGAPVTTATFSGVDGSLSLTNTQTTVSGSTSGTAKFSQPFQGSTYKKVIVYCAALLGTASYTFTTAFTNTPAIITTNGPASSVVTALSTTAMTVTGATTTGFIIIEGY